MTKLFASLFAAALLIGLGSAPTLTYAEEGAMEEAEESAMDSEDSMKDSEDSMKEESDAMEEDSMEETEDSDSDE